MLVHAAAVVRLKCSFHCLILFLFVVFQQFWGAKVRIIFELRKIKVIFFSFHFSFFTFFRTFAPEISNNTYYYIKYDQLTRH